MGEYEKIDEEDGQKQEPCPYELQSSAVSNIAGKVHLSQTLSEITSDIIMCSIGLSWHGSDSEAKGGCAATNFGDSKVDAYG